MLEREITVRLPKRIACAEYWTELVYNRYQNLVRLDRNWYKPEPTAVDIILVAMCQDWILSEIRPSGVNL